MKYLYFLLIIIFSSTESCTNKKVEPISPIANFSFELGKNGEVKFINTSQNGSSYQWEFGDGETSSEINPIHMYKIENTYKVKLVVSSIENIKNEVIKEININNFTPKASFEYALGDNGTIKLKNTSINSKNFIWFFGDGERSTEENPSHTYNANAKYIVKLIATNSNSKDSTQTEVQIKNVPASTNVFICDDNGTCYLLNTSTGGKVWEFQTEKYILSSPTFANDLLFISTTEDTDKSKIIAIDYLTGKKKWEFQTSKRNVSSPMVYDNKLYSISYGTLYCLDIYTGNLIWSIESNNFKDSSPTIYNNNIYVVSDLGLEIFDAQKGKNITKLKENALTKIQETKGIDIFHSSPAIYNDVCYYFLSLSNFLVAYDIKTKQSKVQILSNSTDSSPTIENGILYINDSEGLTAISTSNFQKQWLYKFQKKQSGWHTVPIVDNDLVYTTGGGKIIAVNSKTGQEKWSIENGSWGVYSSPNYYNSILYITTGQNLIALDGSNGSLKWQHKLNNSGLGKLSSPLIINEKKEAFHSSISGAKQ